MDNHLCLVGEVVQTCKDEAVPKRNFPIKTPRAIAAQIILGVAEVLQDALL